MCWRVQHPFWTMSTVSALPFFEELFMSDADAAKNRRGDSLYAHLLPSVRDHQGLNICRWLTINDITRIKSGYTDRQPLDDRRGLLFCTVKRNHLATSNSSTLWVWTINHSLSSYPQHDQNIFRAHSSEQRYLQQPMTLVGISAKPSKIRGKVNRWRELNSVLLKSMSC